MFNLFSLSFSFFSFFFLNVANNETEKCYFVFRWIICLFKREFMKSKTDDYDDVLIVWETIWSVHALYSPENETQCDSQLSRAHVNMAIVKEEDENEIEKEDKPEKILTNSPISTDINTTKNENNKQEDEEKNNDDDDDGHVKPDTSRSDAQVIYINHHKNDSNASLDGKIIIDHSGHCFTSDNTEEDFTNLKSKPSSFNPDKESIAELTDKLSQRLNMDDLETFSLNQEAHSIESSEPQVNCPKLENVELFCLCICLAIIRRERDLILASELGASEILKVI